MKSDEKESAVESETEISDAEMRVFVNMHVGTAQIMSVADSINEEFHHSLRKAMADLGKVCISCQKFLEVSDINFCCVSCVYCSIKKAL